MDTVEFSDVAFGSFSSFVREQSLDELSPDEHTCLADYIYTWVMRGGGADVCQRNFTLLLLAINIIAHYWHHYATTLDYVPSGHGGTIHILRRAEDLFPLGYGVSHPILDPNIFA